MPRSIWKGPYIDKVLYNKLLYQNLKNNLKIWSRRSVILPQFENKIFQVYNGKTFVSLSVKENMIGHKFGEFVSTRKNFSYKKTKNK